MPQSFPLSILIVDHDLASLMAIQGLVASRLSNIHLDLAGSAEGALTCNDAREYQVVLTEMDLTGLDGFGLMRGIHATRPYTPVLVLSSKANLLAVMVGSGAFGYLHKPLNAGYCIAAIRHAVQYHKLKVK